MKSVQRGQGIGYIRDDNGRDFFFHKADVLNKGYNDLQVGTPVQFDIIDDPISGARAEHIKAVRRGK